MGHNTPGQVISGFDVNQHRKQNKKKNQKAQADRRSKQEVRHSPPIYAASKAYQLQLSPLAYLKLQFLCHAVSVEVGCFGLSRSKTELLYVEDVCVLEQNSSYASTEFNDVAIGNYYEDMGLAGVDLQTCARIWFHTHPEMSARPSATDEATFANKFGDIDWVVMAILSKTNDSYARLKINSGVSVAVEMPWSVDWKRLPESLERMATENLVAKWKTELSLVHELVLLQQFSGMGGLGSNWEGWSRYLPDEEMNWPESSSTVSMETVVSTFDRYMAELGWFFDETSLCYEDHFSDLTYVDATDAERIWKEMWIDQIRDFCDIYPTFGKHLPEVLINAGRWPDECKAIFDKLKEKETVQLCQPTQIVPSASVTSSQQSVSKAPCVS